MVGTGDVVGAKVNVGPSVWGPTVGGRNPTSSAFDLVGSCVGSAVGSQEMVFSYVGVAEGDDEEADGAVEFCAGVGSIVTIEGVAVGMVVAVLGSGDGLDVVAD